MKKILLSGLLLLLAVILLTACQMDPPTPGTDTNGTTAGEGTGSPDPSAFAMREVTVTRPQTSKNIITYAGVRLGGLIEDLSGRAPTVGDDLIACKGGELIVGNTNRPESTQAIEKLAGEQFAFCILRVGNKLAICGTTDEMTVQGVNYFEELLRSQGLNEQGELAIPQDYCHIQKSRSVSLVENGVGKYKIVIASSQMTNAMMTRQEEISNSIKAVTGKTTSFTLDTKTREEERSMEQKEILLGATYYPQSTELIGHLAYNEYGMAVTGNKILVFGYSEETTEKAVALFKDVVKRNIKGKNVTLPADMLLVLRESSVKVTVPAFPEPMQSLTTVEGDATMIYISDTTAEKLNAYSQTLFANGLTLHDEHNVGNTRALTFADGKNTVQCYFDASDATVRIIYDTQSGRPQNAEENQYTAKCDPLLTQVGLNYQSVDAGMSYILRLSDGRFLIFDGGSNDNDEAKKLYDLLCSQSEGTKPVIAAWFLTHAHEDHYGAMLKFLEQYRTQVKVERIVYNLPTPALNANMSASAPMIDSAFAKLSGTEIIYARTGQLYCIADAEVEVLLTPEDFYPSNIRYDNDTSVVYRVRCKGQSFMVLGDSTYDSANILLRRYGAALKSDIMQVAHHGYDGVDALYRAIDPTVVLWPCPDQWFHEARRWNEVARWKFNEYLVTSPNIKETLNSGHGTATLKLPYTPQPLPPKPAPAAGEVLYTEDFEDMKDLYESGWYYINSLLEARYPTSMRLTTQNGKKGLQLTGGSNSLLGIIRPDLLENVSVYTLELELNVASLGDGLGIRFNDPNQIDLGEYAQYSVNRTGKMTLTLEVDCTTKSTRVLLNGSLLTTLSNTGSKTGGISLWLSGASVFVDRVTLTAGKYSSAA